MSLLVSLSGESAVGVSDEGAKGDKAPAGADAGQRSCTGVTKEKYNLCDMMFSMEKGGCAVAESNQGASKQEAKASDGGTEGGPRRQDTSRTGHAPWQDGVLERLGEELSPAEYNMYMVHHGRMLLTFGKIQACTPREKDFVYGSLEPIPLRSLQSFKARRGSSRGTPRWGVCCHLLVSEEAIFADNPKLNI